VLARNAPQAQSREAQAIQSAQRAILDRNNFDVEGPDCIWKWSLLWCSKDRLEAATVEMAEEFQQAGFPAANLTVVVAVENRVHSSHPRQIVAVVARLAGR
jgi:hypothetical protein